MCLVDDDEIEISWPETLLVVYRIVDEVHHRGIGGYVHAAVGDLLGDEIDGGGAGQMLFERIGGLVYQGGTVGEKQHPFDPVGLLQQVDERDDGAGLAGAGGHH